jgi:hypothetical protein
MRRRVEQVHDKELVMRVEDLKNNAIWHGRKETGGE